MNRLWIIPVILAVSLSFIPIDAGREMNIPPTNAFSKIKIGNTTLTALTWDSLADLTAYIGNGSSSGNDTNTAQIVSAGGRSIFKQRDNATQNTLYGVDDARELAKDQQENIAKQKFDGSKIQKTIKPVKDFIPEKYGRLHDPVPNMMKAYIDYAQSKAGHS